MAKSFFNSTLWLVGCAAALALTPVQSLYAADEVSNSTTCPNAGVFSGALITDICWECVFPLMVSGLPISGGSREDTIPPGHADKPLCMCDNPMTGLPMLGFQTSFWEPFRLIETVRESGCSEVLTGVRFPFDRLHQGKHRESGKDRTNVDGVTFKHYHYYSFPAMYILQMFVPRNCNPGGFMDIDAMYLSEVDPTWNDDEISFFTNPENALIASPLGITACIPDAVAANVGKPVAQHYWCAGSWGLMYPATGNVRMVDPLTASSLMSARILYTMHRRGFEWKSMGDDSMCGGEIAPFMPKQQYRLSMFHPVAETDDNHVIGQTSLVWGLGRQVPAVGEDPVWIVWRWIDCCNTM